MTRQAQPFPLVALPLFVALAWGCGGASSAQSKAPGSAPPPPPPSYGVAGPNDGIRLAETPGATPQTSTESDDDDSAVPGGGSSAPPTGEEETDEGEEIMLGALPLSDASGSSGPSSLAGDGASIQQSLTEAIRGRRAKLAQCSARSQGGAGKITVTFVVGTDGKMHDAKIASSTTGDDELDGCLLAELQQVEVPPQPKKVRVTLPLVVASGG